MNAKAVIAELEATYPGAVIKQLPEDSATEIVCEFDPKAQHPDFSLAMAVIDRSAPHFHKHTIEIYRIIRGELKLHVEHEEHIMFEGQEFTISPGKVHWAEGDSTWVEVYCTPGYSPDDHILVE